MKEEMSSLKKNHTWELVDQPPGRKLISCKWLYKIKDGIEGVQKPRVILSLTACEDYELEQLDVKTAFFACKSEIEYTKGLLQKEYDMKELGPTRKILGMEIIKDRGSRTLKDVERMSKVPHANAVGLVYGRDQGKHVDVDGFVDADCAKDPNKEAEYMALTEAAKESIWFKVLLIDLGVNLRSVVVNCDNQGAIHLSRNAVFHERTKHINVRYHFIREIMESKEIKVAKIGTKDNAADKHLQRWFQVRSSSIAWRYLVSGLTSLVTKVEIVSLY
ncbi:retrovirus-related pol polyprotein from transposon TNT 1-94 [Tanacetum coccineum]